tara:strand:- start:9566 stop:10159 length:594 start_codon:yes stop_codon:yes gene_type:complete
MKNKRFQKLPDYLSKEQQRDFLRVANKFHNTKNVFRKNNVLLCIKLQLYTGLRIQEVLNLTPNDVFLGENTNELKVVQGKGYKDRIVPLAAPVSEMLRFINSYLKPPKNMPYIPFKTRKAPWVWYKKIGLEAGIEIHGTHILRHTFARNCLSKGVPINVVQNLLGHADLNTTLVYLEILPSSEELNLAMDKIKEEIE